jgi:hypothetical protein
MREQFVYLAVVLDAFSRRVVGWAMAAILILAFCPVMCGFGGQQGR